ncbi:hypothetical protein [Xanthobacter autotrophicus]|uniref:hypothetical protein n=1 Tax=Xanthobacter autotrophicus TaxID=280 RepID=UPI00372C325C
MSSCRATASSGYLRTLKAANATVLADLQTLQPGATVKFTYVEGLAINAVQ